VRFNNLKTEIIPLGSTEDRENLIQSRELNGWRIPNEIRIAQDSEATRILGSWQGSNIDIQEKWNEIMERQQKTINRWNHLYPSVTGRVLLAKSLVISLAQYFMTVNGISQRNLTTMEKGIRQFIWNGKKGQLAWNRAILPVKEGGISDPSAKLRYETVKVGWLKRWWRTEPDRPDWAEVANELIYQSANQTPKVTRNTVKEWIHQTWPIKSRSEKLPKLLKEMIETAQKYNAKISVMRATPELKMGMPAFHHPFARNRNLRTTSKAMKCLQDEQKAKTVGDLVRISSNMGPLDCGNNNPNTHNCRAKAKELLKRISDAWNPNKESPQ